jgi:[ribosomal protein S5]-alanine N-acetyltransferase
LVRMEGLEPSPLRTRPSNVRVYRFRHIRMPILYRFGPFLSIGSELETLQSKQVVRGAKTRPPVPRRRAGVPGRARTPALLGRPGQTVRNAQRGSTAGTDSARLVNTNLTDPAACAILPLKSRAHSRGSIASDALLDTAARCPLPTAAASAWSTPSEISRESLAVTNANAAIASDRLDLVAMTPAFLEAALSGDARSAERILGLAVPPVWYEKRGLMAMRLDQLRQAPSLQPWLVRAIVLRGRGDPGCLPVMIGHIGFHTGPDPEYLRVLAPHAVELGYSIFPPYRRRGYAREAVQALMDWARREHGVSRFVVSISPQNAPSLALARDFGFQRIGSHLDEVDGPEDIFELRLA